MARAGTFLGENGFIDTPATGATAIVDVLKNGTTIYSTKPTFAIASNTAAAGVLSVTSFAAGDRITFKITQKYSHVKKDDKILFNPNWGNFDLICGQKITSVFGGPADKQNYYEFLEIEKQYTTKINKSIDNNLKSIAFHPKLHISLFTAIFFPINFSTIISRPRSKSLCKICGLNISIFRVLNCSNQIFCITKWPNFFYLIRG